MKKFWKTISSFSVVHEVILNLSVPLILSFLFDLSARESLLLVIGSFLVDFDHVLHCLYKGIGWRKMKKYFQAEFALHRPHIYIFHVLEVLIALILLSYYLFPSFLFLFLGFALNVLIDIVTYIVRHRSFSPWGRFFLGSYNYFYLKKLKNSVIAKTQQG